MHPAKTSESKTILLIEDDDDIRATVQLLLSSEGYKVETASDGLIGLERAFHATRCADEGHPKPHPDMLLHLMDRLAVKPHATLMIGDTTHDLDLARNAGAQAVAVTYGAHPPGELQRSSPLASVHSVAELREWLQSNG